MIRPVLALLVALMLVSPVAAQSTHQLLGGESVGINPRYLLQDPRGRSVTPSRSCITARAPASTIPIRNTPRSSTIRAADT